MSAAQRAGAEFRRSSAAKLVHSARPAAHDVVDDLSMRDVESAIAKIAIKQRGLITYPALRGIGLSEGEIAGRVERRQLIPVLHNVYLVALPVLDQPTLTTAALLTSRAATMLVDDSAAAAHRLLDPPPALVTLGSPTHRRTTRRRTEIVMTSGRRGWVHTRRATVPADELVKVGGEPSTSIARTLLDLANLSDNRFDRALHEGMYRDLIVPADVQRVIDAGGRKGKLRLEAKFNDEFFIDHGEHGVDSPAEYAAIRMVVAAGLPEPLVNHWVRAPSKWRRLDLYFEAVRLAVEIDGWQGHRSRDSFEDDPYRDTELGNIGIHTMRFTARRAQREPEWCCDSILARIREREAMFAALGGSVA